MSSTYQVKAGDSLSIIATKYGKPAAAWSELYAANPKIENPNLIYPGTILKIPESWGFLAQSEADKIETISKNALVKTKIPKLLLIGGLGFLAYKLLRRFK